MQYLSFLIILILISMACRDLVSLENSNDMFSSNRESNFTSDEYILEQVFDEGLNLTQDLSGLAIPITNQYDMRLNINDMGNNQADYDTSLSDMDMHQSSDIDLDMTLDEMPDFLASPTIEIELNNDSESSLNARADQFIYLDLNNDPFIRNLQFSNSTIIDLINTVDTEDSPNTILTSSIVENEGIYTLILTPERVGDATTTIYIQTSFGLIIESLNIRVGEDIGSSSSFCGDYNNGSFAGVDCKSEGDLSATCVNQICQCSPGYISCDTDHKAVSSCLSDVCKALPFISLTPPTSPIIARIGTLQKVEITINVDTEEDLLQLEFFHQPADISHMDLFSTIEAQASIDIENRKLIIKFTPAKLGESSVTLRFTDQSGREFETSFEVKVHADYSNLVGIYQWYEGTNERPADLEIDHQGNLWVASTYQEDIYYYDIAYVKRFSPDFISKEIVRQDISGEDLPANSIAKGIEVSREGKIIFSSEAQTDFIFDNRYLTYLGYLNNDLNVNLNTLSFNLLYSFLYGLNGNNTYYASPADMHISDDQLINLAICSKVSNFDETDWEIRITELEMLNEVISNVRDILIYQGVYPITGCVIHKVNDQIIFTYSKKAVATTDKFEAYLIKIDSNDLTNFILSIDSFMSNSLDHYINAITSDVDGYVYVCGASADLETSDAQDIFVAKYDINQVPIERSWIKYLSSNGRDSCHDIVVDSGSSPSIYITGNWNHQESEDEYIVGNAFIATLSNNSEDCLVNINSDTCSYHIINVSDSFLTEGLKIRVAGDDLLVLGKATGQFSGGFSGLITNTPWLARFDKELNFYDHILSIQNLPDQVIARSEDRVLIEFSLNTTLSINSIELSFDSSNSLIVSNNNASINLYEDANATLQINIPQVQTEVNVTISINATSHNKEESVDFNLLIQP
jgi:hypothetical protein